MSAAFSDFPEPQFNSMGMMLLSFNDASQFCAKKNKRLPTILEAARWGKHHGASMATPQDAKERHRANPTSAVYIERTNKTSTVDFYFEKSRFVYPAQRPITNAAIWTSDKRALGGNQNASHYAFSMYEAYFSPVPETSALAVVCLDNK